MHEADPVKQDGLLYRHAFLILSNKYVKLNLKIKMIMEKKFQKHRSRNTRLAKEQ